MRGYKKLSRALGQERMTPEASARSAYAEFYREVPRTWTAHRTSGNFVEGKESKFQTQSELGSGFCIAQ